MLVARRDKHEVRYENVGHRPAWISYTYRAQLDQVVTYGPVLTN